MHKPDPVEAILARLMPTALSEEGQRGIEAMIDELAGIPAENIAMTPPPQAVRWDRRVMAAGIAAAIVAAAVISPMVFRASPLPRTAGVSNMQNPAGFVLVSESDRVESTTDEGWHEYSDGSAMHAMRLSVVEENSLRDEETGIVMQVSEPREEIFLMPVNAF